MRRKIVIIDLFRRRHGRIGKAQGRRCEFELALKTEMIGLLVEGYGMLLAALKARATMRGNPPSRSSRT